MRTYIVLLFTVLSFGTESQAQVKNKVAAHLSYNRVELSYGRELEILPVGIEGFIGLGNQDVNTAFDDFLGGIRIAVPILSFEKSQIQVLPEVGFYISNNDCYSAQTCVLGIHANYCRYLGKKQKHFVQIDAGYVYGKRSYRQTYENDRVYLATTGTFSVKPLYVALGYGFRF